MKKDNKKIILNVKKFLNTNVDETVKKVENEEKQKTIKNETIDSESEIIKKEVKEWLKLNAERISKELITKKINKD
tara:strand:+ start:145 stop:372 length:228 start_codon:yes stop_codon:yes gene_type:complete